MKSPIIDSFILIIVVVSKQTGDGVNFSSSQGAQKTCDELTWIKHANPLHEPAAKCFLGNILGIEELLCGLSDCGTDFLEHGLSPVWSC
jgi:hypothetical protein